MCASRAAPSGKVYRQLFDAQVQLSRSLLAGRRDTRRNCLSAEDSNTQCSTTSRWPCPLSSSGQLWDTDDDVDDVSRLPDTVVVDRPNSDIIEQLSEKKSKKHKEALKQLETELTELTQVCESQVRTVSLELLSSLQEVDLRLNTMKDRMEHLEDVGLQVQEVCVLWEEVEEEVKLKRSRIMDLKHRLTECETHRAAKIRVVLRKFCHLLHRINFLSPPDVCRLIHTKATMLNQSLLANRRSAARVLLLLQEENLQQESLLHMQWENCLSHWRRSQVNKVIDCFRSLCSSDVDQQLVSAQQKIQEMTEQRCDIIHEICSLVPPYCSTALVSDWFGRLTAVNQQIDSHQDDLLHHQRCSYEHRWQDRLFEVQRCQEVLSALQLSDEEVNDIVSSQLLPLIGQSQSQDEERLAALDLCCDSVARHALNLSRHVFAVLRGAALLWETHSRRLERREEELQKHLADLRGSQQQHIQRKKVRLNNLLAALRQESSEDALKMSLDKSVHYLQDIKLSRCVSDQSQVLDRVPSVCLEELLFYSSRLSSFYHLNHTYRLNREQLQNLCPPSTHPSKPETSGEAEIQNPEELTENHPISCENDADPAQPSHDWLTEAEASLLDLYDVSSDVIFTSSSEVAYSVPAFRCPAPYLPDNLQQETHLSLFPMDLLTVTLSRWRTLFMDHLEQHIHDVLSSAIAMGMDRSEAVRLEQELQLQQLNPQHIETHIYLPRLAELQCHRQLVDVHCQQLCDMLTSCKVELQELQASISRKNQDFTVMLSNMEEDVLTADSSRGLEAVSSALQLCLDQHIKDTQCCETAFRQTVQMRLDEVQDRTTQLLNSFRLFSEGGDFAPQEVKKFQRRLKEETKQISATKESIFCQLEAFQSSNLQQVKEASDRFEEKLCSLKLEVTFTEKIQDIMSSTQVHIKAEAACSNQQQLSISSRLEDLRRTMENPQVSPGQVCSFLSSVHEELMKRCQYLDFSLERLLAQANSRKPVQSAPLPVSLQPSRTGVDLLDDPAVGVIKSLNSRFSTSQEVASEVEERRKSAAGQSPGPQLQREAEFITTGSVRRACRSIRTDRRFQVFGPEPEQNTTSFSSSVNSVLWRANDILLLFAEDFYSSECCAVNRFLLFPDSLDQWAECMQLRLLGYQEQAREFLSMSRGEVVNQLSVMEELLHSLPAVLVSNHGCQREAELREVVGRVRLKLEETMAASETEKHAIIHQLRASLRQDELQTLDSREQLRQQQLHRAICCTHLELQECLRVRGEEFVTSLASLTENLLCQLDTLLTPAETKLALSQQQTDDTTVAMETAVEPENKPCTLSRTWSGILYFTVPNSTTDLTSSATMTASITTTRCTLGHLAVIEQRDAAVQRFEQLIMSESSYSDDDKQSRLSELQTWNTHWRQQIHTLTHTLETADTHTDTHTGDSRYTH